jgi:hypothetical protein
MTPEEREEMDTLCLLIQGEKDHEKFTELVKKLSDLLGRKERRIADPDKQRT